MLRKIFLVLALLLCFYNTLGAQGKFYISGMVFADYYYNYQNNAKSEQNRNAFIFRRIYLTFDKNITSDIKVRLRLESAHGKYGTTSKIFPFVKNAYLEWSNLIPRHRIYFGISETNCFKNAERYWGYRSIEKDILGLNKISSSADMGIGIKGELVGNVLHHWVTVFNGTGYGSSEVDRYKKISYSLWVTPVKGLMLEAYADYEKQDPDDAQNAAVLESARDYRGSTGYYTVKGFMGYKRERFSFGIEVFMRTNKESGIKDVIIDNGTIKNSNKADVKKIGLSIFGSVTTPVNKLRLFARYDYFDPNKEEMVYTDFSDGKLIGGSDDESTLIIAGLDYFPCRNVHILPNILVKGYSKRGMKSDITARITLYYTFDSKAD